MAKRLTDTDKWKDDWYISLSNDYKIIWQWLLDNCNHAGICKRSINALNKMCDAKITEEELLHHMNGRIITCNGSWFIPNFIKFQYSTLFSNKPAVISVVNELVKSNCYQMIPKSFDIQYQVTQELINAIKNKDRNIKDLIDNELYNYKIIVPEQFNNNNIIIKDTVTVTDTDTNKKDEEIFSGKSGAKLLSEESTFTFDDMRKFVIFPYSTRVVTNPEFKSVCSEILYERYQKVVNLILSTYPNIRCNFMLTLAEFKKIAALHSDDEIESGLKKLASSGNIKQECLLHLRIKEYIGYANRDKQGESKKTSKITENFD
jgi:hypothetical protein